MTEIPLVDLYRPRETKYTEGSKAGKHGFRFVDIFCVSTLAFTFEDKLAELMPMSVWEYTGGNVPGEQAEFLHGELGHFQQPAMKHRGSVFHSRVRKIHSHALQQPHELLRKARLNLSPRTVGSSLLDNFFRMLDLGPEVLKLCRRALKHVVWDQGEKRHENRGLKAGDWGVAHGMEGKWGIEAGHGLLSWLKRSASMLRTYTVIAFYGEQR
ncbi:hypothetical protein B0H11DRAFT_1935429 [Mycena galericulata]|nr:hypothetical protein B0H11DRAFT_1935429 [Mycena galericulata]